MKPVVFAVGILFAVSAFAQSEGQPPSSRSLDRIASVSSPAGGPLEVFIDQESFDASIGVTSGLVLETFEGGSTEPATSRQCDEPVSSLSDDICFSPGDLEGDFAITSTSGDGIVTSGAGLLGEGITSVVIGALFFADSTNVTFTPTINAFSMDLYDAVGANEITIDVYDASKGYIGTATATPSDTAVPVFIGIVSNVPIGSVAVNATGTGGELLDNLRFAGPNIIFRDGFGGTPPVAPSVRSGFIPSSIDVNENSQLTISLENTNGTAATLISDFVDTLPQGVVVAQPSDVTTTCQSAVVTAPAGAGSVTLDAGANIPAHTSCTITVSVSASDAGFYLNLIPAAALQTDLGANRFEAAAELAVSDPASCNPLQLLQDPGFEATDASSWPYSNLSWDSTSTHFGTSFCDSDCGLDAYDGEFYVWLGGVPGTEEIGTVSQTVTIPAGQPRFLNFWLWVGAVADGLTRMDVSVDQTVVETFLEPAIPDPVYEHRGVDLSSYADGASHTVAFTYTSPGSPPTSFFLDNVTIDCVAASDASRPPATPSSGQTLRATPTPATARRVGH